MSGDSERPPEADQFLWDPEAARAFERETIRLADYGTDARRVRVARGKAKKGSGIDRDQLRADVAAWWAKYPHLPRKNACKAVLRLPDPTNRERTKYPIKLATAVKYTQGLEPPE